MTKITIPREIPGFFCGLMFMDRNDLWETTQRIPARNKKVGKVKEQNAIEISVGKDSRISDIQEAFHRHYPFLKVEFFKEVHVLHDGKRPEKINPQARMGGIMPDLSERKILIQSDKKVIDLKKEFRKDLGLMAFFYRRSGKLWIETSLTDDWSLERQNDEGRLFSS